MTLYALALEATVLLGMWLSLAAWQRDRTSAGRLTFVALTLSASLWGLGELSASRNLLDEVVADRIKYLGALALPALWFGLAARAAGLEMAHRVPWFPLVLLTPSAMIYALLYSERWSPLFLVTVPGGTNVRGPLWDLAIAYSYVLVVTGSALLFTTAFRWGRRQEFLRRLALGLAPLLPLAGNAIYLGTESAWRHDPTPLLVAVSLLVLRSAVFSGGLLEAFSFSHVQLLHQLPLGIVLTDRIGTVLDMNPTAERRLGIPAKEALGRSFEALLDALEVEVSLDVSPIEAAGREAGRLVLLDPVPKVPPPTPTVDPPEADPSD